MNLITGILFLLNTLTPSSFVEVVKNPIYIPAMASTSPVEQTLQQKAENIALAHNIATTTLYNLITSESNWNPDARNNGGDLGIAQINPKYWPDITEAEALDPDFSMNFAADQISKNEGVHWVSCNCVQFIRTMGVHMPRLKDAGDLDVNSNVPIKGGVVKFNYNGVYHLAYIESVDADGIHIREANYEPCKIGERVISPSDPRIVGYYTDSP